MSEMIDVAEKPQAKRREVGHHEICDNAIYTAAEIAQILKCSVGHVRQNIRNGKLPAFKFGERLVRIKGAEVRKWVEQYMGTSLVSSEDNTALSGMKKTRKARRSVADSALASLSGARLVR